MSSSLEPLSTTQWHKTVLGSEPTAEQSRLYSSYPKYKGIADRTLDPKVAEAVLILALRSGFAQDKVLVLAPIQHETWLLQQFDLIVTTALEDCKRYPSRIRQTTAGYTQLFKKVTLMGRLLQLHREPQYWVSFGFTSDDPLPEWMPQRLLKNETLVANQ